MEARTRVHAIYDTYSTNGIGAAWQLFFSFTGLDVPAQGEDTAPQPPSAEMVATSERFFGHGLLPITLYQPDIAALLAASTRVVAAAGTTSKGQFAQRTGAAFAERLSTPLINFPGGHGGFARDPIGLRSCPPPHPGLRDYRLVINNVRHRRGRAVGVLPTTMASPVSSDSRVDQQQRTNRAHFWPATGSLHAARAPVPSAPCPHARRSPHP